MKLMVLLLRAGIEVLFTLVVCVVLVVPAGAGEPLQQLSEQEFLADIPMVYSASRLPQSAQDSAGVTTIIDRSLIRASGARDITDLFRLIPGFQVGTSSGGRSVVSYHGLSGQISQRMQVYVDGRSLYAPYLFGGVDWSTVSVPLEEIERIEIQRGSNSVSYGANAFLGVIHIITRTAAQSAGGYAQIAQGNNGIADRYVRWGQSQPLAQWRLSAGTKSDSGLKGRVDPYDIEYLAFRAELQPTPNQEWSLLSGFTRDRLGTGFEGRVGDPVRTERVNSSYLHARYKHTVSPDQEWSLAYSHTQDSGGDNFEIPLVGGEALQIDSKRSASRDVLAYQHYATIAAALRASWGIEYQQYSVVSQQLFNTSEVQSNANWRAYLNHEWKPSDRWTANIGALWEQDKLTSAQFAPRVSLNWKPSIAHTIKLGYSAAFRQPSLFEQKSNWRVENKDGQTLDIRYLSSGGLVPERIRAYDLVYIGHSNATDLTFDARLFRERITQLIIGELNLLPPQDAFTPNAVAYDLRNNAQTTNTGIEYQLSWRPWPRSLFLWSQYFGSTQADKPFVDAAVPSHSTSLMATHTWSNGWTTGLVYSQLGHITWLGESSTVGEQRLLSLSLARTLRLATANIHVSAAWRRPLGDFDEFRESQQNSRKFWLTLSAEY